MLTQKRVRELFSYDAKNGVFTRNVTIKYNALKGSRADRSKCDDLGYRRISIDGNVYLAHRIAWLYVHGYIPELQVDHVDRNPSNNSLSNLREVSASCNVRNSKTPINNISGVKGVHMDRGKWVAQVRTNGKTYNLGRFASFTEAVCHRFAVEQCLEYGSCDKRTTASRHVSEKA